MSEWISIIQWGTGKDFQEMLENKSGEVCEKINILIIITTEPELSFNHLMIIL